MTHPSAWSAIDDPACLFLALWRYTLGMKPTRLYAALEISSTIDQQLQSALSLDDGGAAVNATCDVLAHHWNAGASREARLARAGLALAAMRLIDVTMFAIHPRSVIVHGMAHGTPSWLEDARERRTLSGEYARASGLSLIARGPFARSARMPWEVATYSITDQFMALKVIELAAFKEDGRQLEVQMLVVDQSSDRGVPSRPGREGSEVVSFVPLAEAKDDLQSVVTKEAGKHFIDVTKGPAFDPAKRFLEAVDHCEESDILIAPELTIEPTDIDKIVAGLSVKIGPRPRLLVAGSGLVTDTDSDQPYNEATILNGNGARLWAHRKVSAYAMLEETLVGLEIAGAPKNAVLMERIEVGDQVTIADVDALGRVLVLICQDFRMAVVGALLKEFQPDWILVPILDSGTSLVRWPTRQARALAVSSEARFVIASSLTMKAWARKTYPGEEMGVAIGPATINKADKSKDEPAREIEVSPEGPTRRHGTIQWRSGSGWLEYSYKSEVPKP